MVIQLKVHSPKGEEKIIDLCDNEEQMKEITVKKLKQIINTTFNTDENLQLVLGGKILDEETPLDPRKITHLSNIHTVLKLSGGI